MLTRSLACSFGYLVLRFGRVIRTDTLRLFSILQPSDGCTRHGRKMRACICAVTRIRILGPFPLPVSLFLSACTLICARVEANERRSGSRAVIKYRRDTPRFNSRICPNLGAALRKIAQKIFKCAVFFWILNYSCGPLTLQFCTGYCME